MIKLMVRGWGHKDPGNWYWCFEMNGMFNGMDSLTRGDSLKSAAEANEFAEKTAARMYRQSIEAIQRGF
jgi:hypothetical protein